MGSIISNIDDKIREHGSWENYQEFLKQSTTMPTDTTMEKKLYFVLSDNADLSGIILPLDGCMAWIDGELEELSQEETEEYEYKMTPIFMTEEEYKNLPEYQG